MIRKGKILCRMSAEKGTTEMGNDCKKKAKEISLG
jgi:hypothetical protein